MHFSAKAQSLLCQVRRSQIQKSDSKLYEFARLFTKTAQHQVMPDDHSKLVPLLPIPNRTVKRLCADDSAGSRVKVGHRQALTAQQRPTQSLSGAFLLLHTASSSAISPEPPRCAPTHIPRLPRLNPAYLRSPSKHLQLPSTKRLPPLVHCQWLRR